MKNRVLLASLLIGLSIGVLPLVIQPVAAGKPDPRSRGEQSLATLSLVLELTPDQIKQANEVIKAGEAAKHELLGKMRERYARLNEVIRTDAPKEADIKALCHEIAGLQEQLIYRNAQTQVAFRKILNSDQLEKLDRL